MDKNAVQSIKNPVGPYISKIGRKKNATEIALSARSKEQSNERNLGRPVERAHDESEISTLPQPRENSVDFNESGEFLSNH